MSITLFFREDDREFSEEFKFDDTVQDVYGKVAPEKGIFRKNIYFDGELLQNDTTRIKDTDLYDSCILSVQGFYSIEQIQDHIKFIEIVKQDGLALEYIEHQTEEMCLEAVKQYGFALEYVKHQTEEICLEAVKQYGFALHYVKHQTDKICLEAVKQDGYALKFVERQTEEICLEAVRRSGGVLIYR